MWISPVVDTCTTGILTDMTRTQTLKASIISAVLVALAFAVVAAQYVAQVFQRGIADSAGIRVVAQTSCSADDTHFTGCSSIL